ncbi:hypothetical protein Ssi03_72450 [Sphaerisporangium siamense]|uniref:Cysteinyl-tRNA synthetase n=1 Tax=Sphaerisporangium siamense TaxID=795645 RepID=A0A7W7D2Y1_9ACTN|nr:hypothetical protein [Sphaerisporangium siamense]MBB4699344.1 hypothetical protein [Sphaerisporangium siamense]GII89255.1 hypothetical protein Ssi03_72450 [Sphaerisporangium siamense]
MRDLPGVLALMGSGETSPTMVEVHRSLARRLGPRPRATLLDTPYAFQENAADISARARKYFATSVGLAVEAARPGEPLGRADWVFSGPGSPTYALDRWTATGVASDLRARVRPSRGVTVLASAAACTAGVAAVPVYEIYKVGAEPHWRDGLDLLAPLGLIAAVIPHYDNAEGGTHDTRYCYLGERRLSRLEKDLPDGAAVLGIDEHTAVIFDLHAGTAEVRGRGGLTVRRGGAQTVLRSGTKLDIAELRELAENTIDPLPPSGLATAAQPGHASATLGEAMRACQARFDSALARRDADALIQAVLDLEAAISEWAADTEEDEDGVAQARTLLREMIARLTPALDLRDPRERLTPLVEPLLALRGELRKSSAYDLADTVREALSHVGVTIQDTPRGPDWSAS